MPISHTGHRQSVKVSSDRLTSPVRTHKSWCVPGRGGEGTRGAYLYKCRVVILGGKVQQVIDGVLADEGQQGSLTLLLQLGDVVLVAGTE